MADLHMAINNSPFGWYAYNVTLDKNKVPVDPAAVPRMPDQIKISVTVKIENKEKEIAFYVAPCSAESPEEFLLYTWDQYMKSCKAKLPASLREDGPTHFRLFPLALGVSATNAWNKVLEENAVNAADEGDGTNDTSYENFKDCVALFLEEISGVKYLGDVIIRFLSRAKKAPRDVPRRLLPPALDHDVIHGHRGPTKQAASPDRLRLGGERLSRPSEGLSRALCRNARRDRGGYDRDAFGLQPISRRRREKWHHRSPQERPGWRQEASSLS